jgi:U4/U6.U5 tri-snRNP-associated protein 3
VELPIQSLALYANSSRKPDDGEDHGDGDHGDRDDESKPKEPRRRERDRGGKTRYKMEEREDQGYVNARGQFVPAKTDDNGDGDVEMKHGFDYKAPRGAKQLVAETHEPQGKEEQDFDYLKRVMGFVGFKSTKNTKIPGNEWNYGARIVKKTRYRQYMNREDGFNRPLDQL